MRSPGEARQWTRVSGARSLRWHESPSGDFHFRASGASPVSVYYPESKASQPQIEVFRNSSLMA
jgi:hypothetical protein